MQNLSSAIFEGSKPSFSSFGSFFSMVATTDPFLPFSNYCILPDNLTAFNLFFTAFINLLFGLLFFHLFGKLISIILLPTQLYSLRLDHLTSVYAKNGNLLCIFQQEH